MKTKLILSSLALAALAVGCSQDEFETINNGANGNQAGLIELSENFMIGGAGVDAPATRTHWALNNNKLTNVYMPIASSTGGNNEIAVSVFSPPDNKEIVANFFPGGDATISIPVVSKSEGSVSFKSACPPPNSSLNTF